MANSIVKGNEIIHHIEQGKSPDSVKSELSFSTDEWFRFSKKAYSINLDKAKQERN
jgi:hypothetical protein